MQVTLNLPKNLYLDLSKSAQQSKRSFDEIVSERLQKTAAKDAESPLALSSDEEVLEAAKLQMPENQSATQSFLLDKNQAGTLTTVEKTELDFFRQIYRIALLRKAQGINEALRRGIIKSIGELE